MRTLTDTTLTDYATAAATLPPGVFADMTRLANRLATHEDDAADALPHAVIAVWRNRANPSAAVARAVQSAARDRLDSWRVATPTDPAADCYSGPMADRAESATYWEDVRDSLTPARRAILDALASDGMSRKAGVSVATGNSRDARLPLRVSVVASALGHAAPRTATDSAAMRSAACVAWGDAATAMGVRAHFTTDPESGQATPSTPAAAALRYVTTDRTDRTSFESRCRAMGLPMSAYVKHGFTADTGDSRLNGPARALPIVPGVSEGMGWGSAGVTYGTVGETPEAKQAKARTRAVDRNDAAAHAYGVAVDVAAVTGVYGERSVTSANTRRAANGLPLLSSPAVCQRPAYLWDGVPFVVSAAGCGCGARRKGTALVGGDHPLTPCATPTDTGRCGCGSKRGPLVRQGGADCHAPRV